MLSAMSTADNAFSRTERKDDWEIIQKEFDDINSDVQTLLLQHASDLSNQNIVTENDENVKDLRTQLLKDDDSFSVHSWVSPNILPKTELNEIHGTNQIKTNDASVTQDYHQISGILPFFKKSSDQIQNLKPKFHLAVAKTQSKPSSSLISSEVLTSSLNEKTPIISEQMAFEGLYSFSDMKHTFSDEQPIISSVGLTLNKQPVLSPAGLTFNKQKTSSSAGLMLNRQPAIICTAVTSNKQQTISFRKLTSNKQPSAVVTSDKQIPSDTSSVAENRCLSNMNSGNNDDVTMKSNFDRSSENMMHTKQTVLLLLQDEIPMKSYEQPVDRKLFGRPDVVCSAMLKHNVSTELDQSVDDGAAAASVNMTDDNRNVSEIMAVKENPQNVLNAEVISENCNKAFICSDETDKSVDDIKQSESNANDQQKADFSFVSNSSMLSQSIVKNVIKLLDAEIDLKNTSVSKPDPAGETVSADDIKIFYNISQVMADFSLVDRSQILPNSLANRIIEKLNLNIKSQTLSMSEPHIPEKYHDSLLTLPGVGENYNTNVSISVPEKLDLSVSNKSTERLKSCTNTEENDSADDMHKPDLWNSKARLDSKQNKCSVIASLLQQSIKEDRLDMNPLPNKAGINSTIEIKLKASDKTVISSSLNEKRRVQCNNGKARKIEKQQKSIKHRTDTKKSGAGSTRKSYFISAEQKKQNKRSLEKQKNENMAESEKKRDLKIFYNKDESKVRKECLNVPRSVFHKTERRREFISKMKEIQNDVADVSTNNSVGLENMTTHQTVRLKPKKLKFSLDTLLQKICNHKKSEKDKKQSTEINSTDSKENKRPGCFKSNLFKGIFKKKSVKINENNSTQPVFVYKGDQSTEDCDSVHKFLITVDPHHNITSQKYDLSRNNINSTTGFSDKQPNSQNVCAGISSSLNMSSNKNPNASEQKQTGIFEDTINECDISDSMINQKEQHHIRIQGQALSDMNPESKYKKCDFPNNMANQSRHRSSTDSEDHVINEWFVSSSQPAVGSTVFSTQTSQLYQDLISQTYSVTNPFPDTNDYFLSQGTSSSHSVPPVIHSVNQNNSAVIHPVNPFGYSNSEMIDPVTNSSSAEFDPFGYNNSVMFGPVTSGNSLVVPLGYNNSYTNAYPNSYSTMIDPATNSNSVIIDPVTYNNSTMFGQVGYNNWMIDSVTNGNSVMIDPVTHSNSMHCWPVFVETVPVTLPLPMRYFYFRSEMVETLSHPQCNMYQSSPLMPTYKPLMEEDTLFETSFPSVQKDVLPNSHLLNPPPIMYPDVSSYDQPPHIHSFNTSDVTSTLSSSQPDALTTGSFPVPPLLSSIRDPPSFTENPFISATLPYLLSVEDLNLVLKTSAHSGMKRNLELMDEKYSIKKGCRKAYRSANNSKSDDLNSLHSETGPQPASADDLLSDSETSSISPSKKFKYTEPRPPLKRYMERFLNKQKKCILIPATSTLNTSLLEDLTSLSGLKQNETDDVNIASGSQDSADKLKEQRKHILYRDLPIKKRYMRTVYWHNIEMQQKMSGNHDSTDDPRRQMKKKLCTVKKTQLPTAVILSNICKHINKFMDISVNSICINCRNSHKPYFIKLAQLCHIQVKTTDLCLQLKKTNNSRRPTSLDLEKLLD